METNSDSHLIFSLQLEELVMELMELKEVKEVMELCSSGCEEEQSFIQH